MTSPPWVIAGGESGPRYRRVERDWLQGLRDQCVAAETAFFFKQWGGRTPKVGGRELDGDCSPPRAPSAERPPTGPHPTQTQQWTYWCRWSNGTRSWQHEMGSVGGSWTAQDLDDG